MENKKKNITWNMVGVSLNAFSSLIFLIIVTRINGTNSAGLFSFAFSLGLLFEAIGYYSGRIFQVTESNKNITNSDFINSRLIMSLVMIIVAIIYCISKNFDLGKIILIMLMTFFRSIESFADCIYAIIQKQNMLYKVGISFTLKFLISCCVFLIIDVATKNILLSTLSIVIIQLIILITYDIKNAEKYIIWKPKINRTNIILIYKTGFFTFLITFLTQYILNSPKYAIDELLTYNDQTIYGIISMPATFMVLISQLLIHPYLNNIRASIEQKDYKKYNNINLRLIGEYLLTSIVVLIIAYYIGIPVLELIYNIELVNYKMDFMIILFGSVIYGVAIMLSNSLIALRITIVQSISFFADCIIAYIMTRSLIGNYGFKGAVNSYFIIMIIVVATFSILYIIVLSLKERRKNNENKNLCSNA